MLDFDLASLYEVPTKVLNQAVKRNFRRFPKDFMFRLRVTEWQRIRSQFVTGYESLKSVRSQIVTASQGKRKQNDLKEQLKEIKEKLGEHDAQLTQIYDAMENLLDEKVAQRKWDDRERIGFKVKGSRSN